MTTTPLFPLTIAVYSVRLFSLSSFHSQFSSASEHFTSLFFPFFEGWEGSLRRMEASDGNEPLPFCVSSKNKAVKKEAASGVIDKLQPGRLARGRVDNPPRPSFHPPSLHTHTPASARIILPDPAALFFSQRSQVLGIRRYEDVL